MSRRRAREEEEEEMVKQQEANDALLEACLEGPFADVQQALRSGASVTATNERGDTGLSLACYRADWDVALQVVELL
jgi:ankyrin repeat protein